MKRAPRSRQRHDLYAKYHDYDSEISDLLGECGFIDVAFGPLTDIALADDSAYDPADLEMLPPIRVRCLTGQDGKPFEFLEPAPK